MDAQPSFSNDNVADAGVYTWDLLTDTLYADSALAELFGLMRSEAEHGLPLTSYLDRVHLEDRPAVAVAVRRAILTGIPFQEAYRVHRANGETVRILAFGKCFRDAQDEPRFYAGIVFPMPQNETGDNELLWHCLAALELAKREGRDNVARSLLDAIRNLEKTDCTEIKLVC